ncbi:MAG: DUF1990 domain-containing protein [Kineosporiaceae bacterium]|nr:DUF1990 domain-containing protein [Aeromicrobium sp.]
MTDFNYREVGATRGALPPGYYHLHASHVLGSGDEVFGRAVNRLMSWDMHRGAGLKVEARSARVIEGAEVVMHWLGQRIPCRVVYVVDEPDRRGFAYGTLAGHPECGEESFVIDRDAHTGVVTATVIAFSKPGRLSAKLLGPLGRALQKWMTSRYLDALKTG